MKSIPVVQSPGLLQLLEWTFQPLKYLDKNFKRYGDCFVTNVGDTQAVYFSHPKAIEDIFTQSAKFDSGKAQQVLRYSMGNNSVLVLDGKPHDRHRQLLMPPFHGERMKAYGDVICEITAARVQEWQIGQRFAVLPHMNDVTLEVILKTVFGLEGGERHAQISYLLQKFLGVAASRIAYILTFFPALLQTKSEATPMGSFMKLRNDVDELLYAEIRDRRANLDPNRSDILTLLLLARDEDGQPLTDEELRDELMTMLLAGHDSSAATISWALYHIHAYPEVRTKLLDELDSLGDHSEPAAIIKLPYLNAACSESLRLRAAGPTVAVRVTNQPVTVMGHELPPNTAILPCQYLTHHREDIYPDPHQFKPERWLERQFSPYEFYPFGGGNRRCIGGAFAAFEMRLVLATILRNCRLALAEKPPIAVKRRGVNIAPATGVRIEVTEKKSNGNRN
jgi:cytochrome P450 family 110